MRKYFAIALLAGLLGGCTSIFGGPAAKLEVRPLGDSARSGATELAAGREALRDGRVAEAIVALRLAALDPAVAASAHNGLAVAYLQIGRGDLAEQYFKLAMVEDPADLRFAANLDRFYRSREAAMAKAVVAPPIAPQSEDSGAQLAQVERSFDRVFQAGPSQVRVSSAAPAMTRVSRQEVAIRTAPAPAISSDPRRRNLRYGAAKPGVAPVREGYPVRVELATIAQR